GTRFSHSGWASRPDVYGLGRYADGGTRRHEFAGRGCLREFSRECRICLRHWGTHLGGYPRLSSARRRNGPAQAGDPMLVPLALSYSRRSAGNGLDLGDALACPVSATRGGSLSGEAIYGYLELVPGTGACLYQL